MNLLAQTTSPEAVHVPLVAVYPQLALVAAGVLGLLAKIVLRDRAWLPTLIFSVAGNVGAAAILVAIHTPDVARSPRLMYLMIVDPFSVFAQLLILVFALGSVFAALPTLSVLGPRRADFLLTLVFSVTGMTITVAALDFLTLYTGFALMFICNYIVLGMQARDPGGTEAALKYFLTSLVASAIFLFGVALVYAASGDTQYGNIAAGLKPESIRGGGLAVVGVALLIASFAFKVGAWPFHMATPDVHQGSPAPAAAFMSTLPVITALLVLFRLILRPALSEGIPVEQETYMLSPLVYLAGVVRPLLVLLGTVSIGAGALTAWVQTNPRRTLGHLAAVLAGFLLIAFGTTFIQFQIDPKPRPFGGIIFTGMIISWLCLMLAAAGAAAAEAFPPEARRGRVIARLFAAGLSLLLGLILLGWAGIFIAAMLHEQVHGLYLAAWVVAAGGLLVGSARSLRLAGELGGGQTEKATFAWLLATLFLLLVPTGIVFILHVWLRRAIIQHFEIF